MEINIPLELFEIDHFLGVVAIENKIIVGDSDALGGGSQVMA